ncbi:MAG: flippase-like domain-containing protein [Rhodocyclaceae bacterium]|nr:flippase-like domain-containing protein [Rhodocyclaceae bacterium]
MIRRIGTVALTLALVLWVLAQSSPGDFETLLARAGWSAMLPAVLGLFASYALRALRIWDEFRHDTALSYLDCLRLMLIHNAFVNLLPLRSGELAFPILLKRHAGIGYARSTGSLLWWRLQDISVLLGIAALTWPELPPTMRVLVLAGWFALVFAGTGYAHRYESRLYTLFASSPGMPTTGLFGKLLVAFAQATRASRRGWLWTIANWSVKLVAQSILLAALLPGELRVAAVGVLGAEAAAVLPVQGVAGFGSFEAGAAAALATQSYAFSDGLRVALLLHLFVLACAVLASFPAWLLQRSSTASLLSSTEKAGRSGDTPTP